MEVRYGLISADSHVVLHRDTFTSRMSHMEWGDRIPHVAEIVEQNPAPDGSDRRVERWVLNGQVTGGHRGLTNCPAAMGDPLRKTHPQRWDEVPQRAYDPLERLKALDDDCVDAEVLFPNDPGQGLFFQFGHDPEFELACVRAHNDALAEWRAASDRYAPLAVLPYLSDIEVIAAEVERAAGIGLRGINMLAEPSITIKGLKHFNEPYWNRLWQTCQDLDLPVHLHESAGLASYFRMKPWDGYTQNQAFCNFTVPTCAFPAQLIPNLIFSGILERYPRLKWVSAETGLGWVAYVLEGCDHVWERRRLWKEGIRERPSEVFRRQVYVDFWYEVANVELRHLIGLDNIMWQSDYPHTASTYPESRKFVERSLGSVPEDERQRLLFGNAMRVYRL